MYWLFGTVTFLVTGAIVVAQLNRFLPVDGSIRLWEISSLDTSSCFKTLVGRDAVILSAAKDLSQTSGQSLAF